MESLKGTLKNLGASAKKSFESIEETDKKMDEAIKKATGGID